MAAAAMKIAPAQCHRVEFQLARGVVDQPFDDVGGLRPPGAAIRCRQHRVTHDAGEAHVRGREVIHAHHARRVLKARLEVAVAVDVRADVGDPMRAQRDEAAVRIERKLRLVQVVARVLVREQRFAALGLPAHRTPEPLRGPQQQTVLDRLRAPAAERAADVGLREGRIGRLAIADLVDV
jgi:hypothetical protein